jgi:hypothetical protein
MTQYAKKAVRSMGEKMERNTPAVEQKMSASSPKPDPAIVLSAAKYREALERLAKE